ncbi:MAG: sporulation protein YqfC [Ruminococcaceae bacterium]|nr:sporulation protein YqfC [Oscillospiraceae bacterium]
MKKLKLKAVSEALALPSEYVASCSKITVTDYMYTEILNYKSIIEYTDKIIRINATDKIIKISGDNLKLDNITDDRMAISGKINALTFE